MNKLAVTALLTLANLAAAQGPIDVYPPSIDFRHPRHAHAVAVTQADKDGYSIDRRDEAKIVPADPKIASVDETGRLRPLANGKTTVAVTLSGQTKTIDVQVNMPVAEPSMSFRHEVMPVLTRAGCNQGACHGYSLGKNGFKLSLRGQDPAADYQSLFRDLAARRLNYHDAAKSLLVQKGRGEIPHEGGAKLGRGSLADDILVKWIEQGAPEDLKDTREVVAVRMVPDKLVLKPGQKHRVQLIAEYSDGGRRDVTRLAVLAANNTQFADVDDEGVVTAGENGETAIVGRFERVFAAVGVTVLKTADGFMPTPLPGHLVDLAVIDKLNRLKVAPSPVAGDEEFLRRVHLDLIGVQPQPEEVRAFLASKDPKKREKVIEALFERPEFVDHWSLKWGDLLQNSRSNVGPAGVYQFREFIRSAVAGNMPADEFATKILTSRGSPLDDPSAVYFTASKDLNDTVERVTQVFCGVRMLCARCHSHPMENWTQADYFGLASFFSQVSLRPDPRVPNTANLKMVQVNPNAGSATNPRTGRSQPPRFLGGDEPKLASGVDRRLAYADWLTSPKNPFFARGLTNRIWSYFFHRGIIDPVDDIRSTNPPINPALLDALTADFVSHKFDLRHLMKQIVTSETYQRTSVPNDSNRTDDQNFSHAIPRRIPAEALLDSLIQATAVPETFPGVPSDFRAAQLPDGNVNNDFLKLFGKPQRMDACECERDNGSNMLQALHFISGKSILTRVQNPAARPALLLKQKMSDEQMVTEVYLWSLARHPSETEKALGLDFLKAAESKAAGLQDLMWALLNSKDFVLVH